MSVSVTTLRLRIYIFGFKFCKISEHLYVHILSGFIVLHREGEKNNYILIKAYQILRGISELPLQIELCVMYTVQTIAFK